MRQHANDFSQEDWRQGLNHLNKLEEKQELALLNHLSKYQELIQSAAHSMEPHLIAHYCRDLANLFHSYYNAHKVLVPDIKLRQARICFIKAIQQIIFNGLILLGVAAPEEM